MAKVLEGLAESLPTWGAKMAYGEKTTLNGQDFVPAALVVFGFGGGEGSGESEGQGDIPAGRGEGSGAVDDAPWVARGHSRETTYQENLVGRGEVAEAVRVLTDQLLEDVRREGRAAWRIGLKIRYAPFTTVNRSRKLAAPTSDAATVHEAVQRLLADHLDAGREVRLLGVRAELVMPDAGDDLDRTPVRGRV